MIPRDAESIGHQTPRPRIDLNPPHVPAPAGPESTAAICARQYQESWARIEAQRIWVLVKGAAEGRNVASSPVLEGDE